MSKDNQRNQSADMLPEDQKSWLSNNFHRLMVGVSVVWCAIVLIYITQFFGWSNLFLMMPDEFGLFLAGISLPLPVIWLVMAFIDRERSFKQEAKFLRAYMNQLVYPEEGSAATARAMADAIRSQVVELQEVTKLAMQQTETIKKELSERVEDFSGLVQVLDNYSTQSIVELTNGVKTLSQSFEGVTERASQTMQDVKKCMNEFTEAAGELQSNIGGTVDKLLPGIQEMRASSETLQSVTEASTQRMLEANENLKNYSSISEENFNQIINRLQTQGQYLEEISEKAVAGSQDVGEKVKAVTSDINELLQTQTIRVDEYAEAMDENIRDIYKKFAEHGEALGNEVDKIISRSNVIEESISIQVNELKNVAEEISGSLGTIETTLNAQFNNLDSRSDSAVTSIQKVVDAFEENVQKLQESTESAMRQASECGDAIEAQHSRVSQFTAGIFENLGSLNSRFGENMESVKSTTEEVMGQFCGLRDILSEQTEKMAEASNFTVTQSKVAEASLEQQNRYINNSINKIEETKNELKRQIEELSHAAEVVAGEANEAVEQLKRQLEASLEASNDVVYRTYDINANLEQSAARFATSAEQTLARVSGLEEIITTQNNRFDMMLANVDEKSGQITDSLARHAAMVDKATADSGAAFKDVLSAFETQSALLNSVAENTVGYVSDVVQALDEKAENINLLFKHQQNEFLEVCDKIAAHTENMKIALKEQISSIEASSEHVFDKMSEMEENIGRRSAEAAERSEQSIERLSEIDHAIGARGEKLESSINELSGRMSQITNEFTSGISSFDGALRDMKNSTDAVTSVILLNADKIRSANVGFNKDVKEFVGQVDGHLHDIDATTVRLKEQAAEIEAGMTRQKELLLDAANAVAAQARLGEASMAKQYQYMQDIVGEVGDQMKLLAENVGNDIEGVYEKAGKISYEINALGDRILKAGEEIGKTSQISIKNIENVNLSLGECAANLSNISEANAAKLAQVMNEYEACLSGLNTVTAEASTGVVEINEIISAQNDKMIHISQDTRALVDYFNSILKDASDHLTEKANLAHDRVMGLGDDLKNLSHQLEDAANMSSKYIEKSGDKLRSTIMEITANAERISNDLSVSSATFLEQAAQLDMSTGQTLDKVTAVMDTIRGNIDEFNSKSDEIVSNTGNFNSVLQKQIELLDIGAKQAGKELLEMEKKYREAKVDTFLKNAAGIIEKLETLAIDINSVFNEEAQEKLWKKYYEGDTDSFVRYLAKNMTRKQVVAIKEEFERNSEFRKVVTAYMSEFEGLINKARSCEKSSVLLSVISGADIGKIYYVIARALDKLN